MISGTAPLSWYSPRPEVNRQELQKFEQDLNRFMQDAAHPHCAIRACGDQRCIHPESDSAGGGLPRWLTW